MIFEFKIDSENAAFSDSPELEVARLLRLIADRLGFGDTEGELVEYNGNRCGDWFMEVPDHDPE